MGSMAEAQPTAGFPGSSRWRVRVTWETHSDFPWFSLQQFLLPLFQDWTFATSASLPSVSQASHNPPSLALLAPVGDVNSDTFPLQCEILTVWHLLHLTVQRDSATCTAQALVPWVVADFGQSILASPFGRPILASQYLANPFVCCCVLLLCVAIVLFLK